MDQNPKVVVLGVFLIFWLSCILIDDHFVLDCALLRLLHISYWLTELSLFVSCSPRLAQ